MKILMVNKFLYPVGGAENYMFSFADKLIAEGHVVQFFGLRNSKNIVTNEWDILVDSYDDKKFFNPFSLVYSRNAKKLMKKLLKLFKPDVVHMNNISFHLTSSIIEACKELKVPVLMTIHDPQLVCCNHMFYRYHDEQICTECLDHNFKHCLQHKCLKGSKLKSYLAYLESKKTHENHIYDYISYYIVPSKFLADKLIEGGYLSKKTIHICNPVPSTFVNEESKALPQKKNYILYYGRISSEKGIRLLLDALPNNIKLIVAGTGPLVELVKNKENVQYVGFKTGEELKQLVQNARFSIYPSIWYENCPLSILESIALGTPVIGTNQGGIPELIRDGETGLLFEPSNSYDLKNKIEKLYYSNDYDNYIKACLNNKPMNMDIYYSKVLELYNRSVSNEKVN